MRSVERLREAVVFISITTKIRGQKVGDLIGTGFVVSYDDFEYVVTAGHVVKGETDTCVRLNRRKEGSIHHEPSGEVEDVPAEHWFHHPAGDRMDLAVTLLGDAVNHDRHAYKNYPLRWGHSPEPAERVFYLGLLEPVRNMGDQLTPFIRSGTVGALDQEGIPVETDDGKSIAVEGHLLDVHGQGGFSGSPVFGYRTDVEHDIHQYEARTMGRLPVPKKTESIGLLGCFLGYFRDASARGPINTGIGIVAPRTRILEVLDQPDLVEDRESRRSQNQEEGLDTDDETGVQG